MSESEVSTATFCLTPQQVHFFETFGFLRLPGLFADDIHELIAAFEAVFADPAIEKYEMREPVHYDAERIVVPAVIDKHPRLAGLKDDDRILGVARSLLGDDFEYAESDGNLLSCDTSWHCDVYDAPMERYHIKLFFYFDPLDAESGALRVLPGTNHYLSPYASSLRQELGDWQAIRATFGVDADEIPSYAIDNQPGDLIVGNFRTIHATFHGPRRRRLCTMNYRKSE
jgi:hypothetical protein